MTIFFNTKNVGEEFNSFPHHHSSSLGCLQATFANLLKKKNKCNNLALTFYSPNISMMFIVVKWLEVICVFGFKPLLFNTLTNAKNSFVYFLQ